MSELLKICNLRGGYNEGVDILQGISMEIREGDAIGIIGLNGSGKSTLGKAIMNMIPIRGGNIYFKGEDVSSLSTNQLSHRGISLMQQGGKVFPNLSVWENLQLAISSKNVSKNDISLILDNIPLLHHSKKELQHLMADKLSGGQKHQLSLAMALASLPQLIILDEPSAGLSPRAVEDLFALLQAIREQNNLSIILIEQNVNKAIEFCNASYVITCGKVVEKKILNTSDYKTLLFD